MDKRSVALFDFDKTIYKDYSIFTSTRYLIDKGYLETKVEVEMLEEYGKYKLGTYNYKQVSEKVLNIHASAMAGLDFSTMRDVMIDFFSESRDKYYPYFEKLLPKLKETHEVFLVTASSQLVAEAIEKIFNLDGYLSTVYEVKEGVLTGKVESSLVDSKGEKVTDLLKNFQGQTMAFGDSDSDIEMLNLVKIPVCVNPIDNLKKVAEEKGWLVVDGEETQKIFDLLG